MNSSLSRNRISSNGDFDKRTIKGTIYNSFYKKDSSTMNKKNINNGNLEFSVSDLYKARLKYNKIKNLKK